MNWPLVKLGDLCVVKRGTTITQKVAIEGKVPVVGGGLKPTYFHNSPNRNGNTITVSGSGASAGFINFYKEPIFASDCSTVEPKNDTVNVGYIYRAMQNLQEYIYTKLKAGAAQPHVYAKDLADLEIPLPPLAEQQRIAALLDTADRILKQRESAIAKLDQLAQSVFVEMFGNSQNFENKKLSELCDLITDGTHYTPTYVDNGVIFLSAKNVTKGTIDWSRVKYVPEKLHNELQKRVSPKIGDILLAKNGTTGVAAIVDRDVVFDIYVSLALLRPKDLIDKTYLHAALNSTLTKRQFNSALKGIGVPNLHLVEIRKVTIPVPSVNEQKKFVEILDKINKLKTYFLKSELHIKNKIYSLQHQLFAVN
jgi:type I restriction enzyme S subunit